MRFKNSIYCLAILLLSLVRPDILLSAEKEMVLIPHGEFGMGSNVDDYDVDSWEKPEHLVYVDAYEIDAYEITVEEYMGCVKAGKCDGEIPGMKNYKPKYPIRMVNWYDAEKYCKWAGKRLPTEAEWEKAARGPKGTINPWGNRGYKDGDAALAANLSPVGSFQKDRSEYGVYDMAGNVQEWVADWYSDNYYQQSPKKNPKGPSEGKERTVRGGSFNTRIHDLQDSYYSITRYGQEPSSIIPYVGFRCARSVGR